MPNPVALTDAQLNAVMAACQSLAPADRDAFLRQVAAMLARYPDLGDGLVARVCREVFSQFWRAPEVDGRIAGGKYAR